MLCASPASRFRFGPLLSLAGVMTTRLLGIWDHGTRPWVRPARPLGSMVTAPRAVALSVGRRRWIRGAFEVSRSTNLTGRDVKPQSVPGACPGPIGQRLPDNAFAGRPGQPRKGNRRFQVPGQFSRRIARGCTIPGTPVGSIRRSTSYPRPCRDFKNISRRYVSSVSTAGRTSGRRAGMARTGRRTRIVQQSVHPLELERG